MPWAQLNVKDDTYEAIQKLKQDWEQKENTQYSQDAVIRQLLVYYRTKG